jgi:hypothetical protein
MTETSATQTPAEPALLDGAEADTAVERTLTQTITPVGDPDAYPPIRILGLRLRGVRRDYVVDFTDGSGLGKDLSLIVGEIATGKTTVLDFIDYCLGASNHPTHTEVTDNVRAAQLAVEILERAGDDDEQQDQPEEQRDEHGGGDRQPTAALLARYVIERPVGGATSKVMLFRGDHNGFDGSWFRRLTMIRPTVTRCRSSFCAPAGSTGCVCVSPRRRRTRQRPS